ncbi:MAG: CHAT domain-containing tetratricopeptide repeat protein, partial [Candidatus Latescibacterota bacterium]
MANHDKLSIVAVILLFAGGFAAMRSAPGTPAGGAFAPGARLLDGGRNQEAIDFYHNELTKNPLNIVAADGLAEASQRLCSLETGLAWLDSVSGSSTRADRAHREFLQAHDHRLRRRFGPAATAFARAADSALEVRDSLAAAVCLRRAARCAVADRDAEAARDAASALSSLSGALSGAGRLAVDAVVLQADAANLADRLQEADSLSRFALAAAERMGYVEILGFARAGLARLQEKRQNHGEAIDQYSLALEAARETGATGRCAKLLSDLAQSETREGDLEKALIHLDEALALVRSCRAEWVLGYIYYGRGAVEEAKGNYKYAIVFFDRSVEYHARFGNVWSEKGARLRLAYRFIENGEYARAIEQYGECLDYYESKGSTYGLGWALAGMALAHHRLGNLATAEDYYLQTLDLRRRLGDRRGTAWCLNSLGMVNDLRGNYRQALEYEHQAMEFYEQIGDARGVGSVLFSTGAVYFYLGDLVKSMDRFEKAYGIAKENGDAQLQESAVSGIASVYEFAGRRDMAEGLYLEHLELTRKAGAGASLVWSLNNIASFYLESGERDKARPFLDEALAQLPETGMDHLRSRALYLAGKSSETPGEAIEFTERSVALAEEQGLKGLLWQYLTDLGQYYLELGDLPRARSLQEEAILCVESIRRGVGSDELRRHLLLPAMIPYERMVSLLFDSADEAVAIPEAFAFTERAKAQIFASLLKEARNRLDDDRDEDREQEKELVSRLSHIQASLQNPELEAGSKKQMIAQMDKIERDLLQVEIRSAGRQAYRGASVYSPEAEPVQIGETLGRKERMLSYFLGRSRSYLFTSDGDELLAFELPDRGTIEAKVNFYIRLLRQLAAGNAELPASVFDDASQQLFDILLGPAAGLLDREQTLLLLPDGILNRLPFALLKNDGAFLIDTHPLYYAPSLRSLYYLRRRQAMREDEDGGERFDLLAFGAGGTRPGEGSTSRVYPLTDIPVEALPLAEKEARSVAGMFDRSMYLVGSGAEEESFKAAPLGRADIVHIAAHSYVDNVDVRRSFIVLNPEDGFANGPTAGEDGLLQWHEIAGLRLNAKLVTLSACRAAGGVLSHGEGITGLTQAFLYAGGDCVLASFIDVPDRFAGKFMEAFYRHLNSGVTGAQALRSAQIEASGWSYSAHGPPLWGSFALIGDGSFVLKS